MTKLSDVKVNDKDYKVISDVTFGTINFKYYKNKWQSEEKIFKDYMMNLNGKSINLTLNKFSGFCLIANAFKI